MCVCEKRKKGKKESEVTGVRYGEKVTAQSRFFRTVALHQVKYIAVYVLSGPAVSSLTEQE